MALQVWLPLDGDLKNRGLTDVTVTNNGATVDDNGKIGKCYYFDGNSYLGFNTNIINNKNSFSICGWIYMEGNNSYYPFVSISNNISSLGFTVHGGCANRIEGGDGTNSIDRYLTEEIPTHEMWHHIVYTYDGIKIKRYIDGVFIDEIEWTTGFGNPTQGKIGGFWGGGFSGYINDFRLYDNCLSAAEVKEISKGLVLHYPLNDPYVEETENVVGLISNIKIGEGWGAFSQGGSNLPYNDIKGNLVLKGNGINGQCYTSCNFLNLESGTYTLSIEVDKIDENANFNVYVWHDGSSAQKTITSKGRHSLTFTTNGYSSYIELNNFGGAVDSIIVLKANTLQLEKKDHPTPYTPSSRNENIVYDCTGYGHNGTVEGPLSVSVDSPRYERSSNILNTRINTITGLIPVLDKGNPFTIAFWIKTDNINDYKAAIFECAGSYLSHKCLHIIFRWGQLYFSFYDPDRSISFAEYVNKWTHVVCEYGEQHMKIYINGELKDDYVVPAGSELNMNDLNYVGVGYVQEEKSTTNTQLSDFRIYSTALSEADVKELYNTGAKIAKNGTLMCYELKED